jgi:hypothetical protein
MEKIDEVVLELRRELEKSKHTNVYTGMYANRQLIRFQRFFFFQDKMSIMLPEDFQEMDPDMARFKYPAENRPELILTSEDSTVNFTLKYVDVPVREEELLPATGQLRAVMGRLNPSNLFFESDTLEREDGMAVWFDYKSYALDDAMYNFMYLTDIDGHLLQGACNCPFAIYKEWKEIARQVVMSVRDRTKEESNGGKTDSNRTLSYTKSVNVPQPAI